MLTNNNLYFCLQLNVNTGLSIIFDGKREDYFSELIKWAGENGAFTDGFEVANFEEEGFGLKATRDIKVSKRLLCFF